MTGRDTLEAKRRREVNKIAHYYVSKIYAEAEEKLMSLTKEELIFIRECINDRIKQKEILYKA